MCRGGGALMCHTQTGRPPGGASYTSEAQKKKPVLVLFGQFFFNWLIERSSISAFKCARSRLLELRTDFRSPGQSVRLGALCIGPPEIVYRLCTRHSLWTMHVCIHTKACACAMYICVHVCADVGVLLCVYKYTLVHTTWQ